MPARTARLRQRPLNDVPKTIFAALVLSLCLQIGWRAHLPPPSARGEALPLTPALTSLRVMSLGDDVALSKILNLWLQMYDNQPGISIPFRDLDYARVRGWLQASLDLDPRGSYPLLAAVRLYGQVSDPEKQKQMLEFAYEKFLEAPNSRWPWMAHAVTMAQHRLKDRHLALKYARALAANATGPQVPHWAQQMSVFVLENLGETDAARILIGGLLESGQITDPHEFRFLSERLDLLSEPTQAPRDRSTTLELQHE